MTAVMCKTEGCENQGITIDVNTTWIDDDGNTQNVSAVMCGVCGQQIEWTPPE